MPDSADRAQIAKIAEQVVIAAITQLRVENPELLVAKEAAIPAPLKWAGAIIAGLFTAGTATLAFWLVSTVSEMQVTLARMDERMQSGTIKDARYDDIERRVTKLEGYHSGEGK